QGRRRQPGRRDRLVRRLQRHPRHGRRPEDRRPHRRPQAQRPARRREAPHQGVPAPRQRHAHRRRYGSAPLMAILNPSFEDAGAAPGEAEHWTIVTVTSLERIAGFGPAPHRAWEDFERWFDLLLAFGPGQLALAFFDPIAEGFEDFEEAWANDLYMTELPAGQVITAPFGGGAVEDMESGWPNVPYTTAWEDVAAVVGMFD